MVDKKDETSACAKSDGSQEQKKVGVESIFNFPTISCAVVATFPAIMSTAIPESIHISVRTKVILLLSALLPLAYGKIFSPKQYFATQRAVLVWLCTTIVLIIADAVYKINDDLGVYGCHYGHSQCWLGSPHCVAFWIIGFAALLVLTPLVIGILIYQISSSTPSQLIFLMTFIASLLTMILVLPISWNPIPLLYALRPLQTILSTFLVSFILTAESASAAWLDRVTSVLSLILVALNAWSFLQFEDIFFFICGLSGSLCYVLVFIVVTFSDEPTEKSGTSAKTASDPIKFDDSRD